MKYFIIMMLGLITFSNFIIAEEAPKNPQHIVKIGDSAPDFNIQYLDGVRKKLSENKGKVIMLQFTASWCSVCRKEMPFIESEIYQKLKNNPDFMLIGIDLKEDSATIRKFQSATKISYPIVLDPQGEIFEQYAEKDAGVTRNVIIDKQGKIRFLTRLFDRKEFDEMKKIIIELLAKD